MNEWFICLTYNKVNFLIPHAYKTENNVVPDLFIDFDSIVYGSFETASSVKHPAALTLKCKKTAMLTTSSIPKIVQTDLSTFYIPSGVLENGAKKVGIIAMSFEHDKKNGRISIIVNPEILYEKWKENNG